jgi:type I restriction enzyme S subunit
LITYVRLSEVCTLEKMGMNPQTRPDELFAHYSIPAFDDGQQPVIENGGGIKSQKTCIERGVVLVSKLNPRIPRVWFVNDEYKNTRICSTEFVPFRPDLSRLLPEYLAFALRHLLTNGQITGTTSAATKSRERARPAGIAELKIPLPPIPEQRRIVDILSRAEGIVRLRREAQKKAAEIIPALFIDMFGDPATNPKGWKEHRLGNLALKMSDGPFGSNLKTSHYTEIGIRVIRLQNIGVGILNDEDKSYVSYQHFASLPKHCCLPDDVIIATLGDPNLRAIVLPPSIPEALNKADCVQFRCNPEVVTSEFICWLMNIPSVLNMTASMVQGITRTRISMGRLRELQIPVPPINIQKKFAEHTDNINSIQSQQSAATQKAEATFNALLSRAFQGELA